MNMTDFLWESNRDSEQQSSVDKATARTLLCKALSTVAPRIAREIYEMSPEKLQGGSLGRLRSAALIAVAVGAAGSAGLLLRQGQRTPRLVLVLMAIWVLSPFIALALANVVSKRWSIPTRATLYGVTLAVTLGSLAVYGDDATGHRRPQAAFVFVLVPPVSWLLTIVAVSIAALYSGRVSRRSGGSRPANAEDG